MRRTSIVNMGTSIVLSVSEIAHRFVIDVRGVLLDPHGFMSCEDLFINYLIEEFVVPGSWFMAQEPKIWNGGWDPQTEQSSLVSPKFARVPQDGGRVHGVGLGMLRRRGFMWFHTYLVSKLLGFEVCCFLVSKFPGFKVSWFQSFKDLPNSNFMFSERY